MIKVLLTVSLFFNFAAFCINSQSFFKDTMASYKEDFFRRAGHLIEKQPNIRLGNRAVLFSSEVITSGLNQTSVPNLINYLLIPSQIKKNLVIIQSGIHGIEGLAGAGIQNFLLEYLHTRKFVNTSFLYIHLANPAGTFLGRRTNLKNVDLNRNFIIKETEFTQKNEDYGTLNYFLNPSVPYESGFLKKMNYYFDAIFLIAQYSIETLRRTILKGQYQYANGLYFGGRGYEPEFYALKSIWDEQVFGYEKIVYIDLHTGYGEKGKLHLLAGRSQADSARKLEVLFKPSTIDFGDSKNFYLTTGDVLTYFFENYKGNSDIYPITFEFGTLNSQTTLGSLESLYRMRSENQSYHYTAKDTKSESEIKKLFREMFYPSDFEWRDKTLSQTRTEIDKIIKALE